MDQHKQGSGYFGFNVVGGQGTEFQMFQNRVVEGMLVGAPTNASTQATGTGASDYNCNIAAGILVCNGKKTEFAAQADYDIGTATTGNAILANGQSMVVSLVVHCSVITGLVTLQAIRGTIATTGSQVAPTKATIEAKLAPNTFWFKLADVTVNRTGDTTVTQSYNNLVRPCLVPEIVNAL